jgi:hypothetical protein
MMDEERLEMLAVEWIVEQVRARRQMKDTLPIEGAMTVPLEWAESLIGFYESDQMRQRTMIEEEMPHQKVEALRRWAQFAPLTKYQRSALVALCDHVDHLRAVVVAAKGGR